ncbi:MAG: PIN domain-containing protein [Actinomycetota bacterium]|nr:PIN domain-containing protein [Actinomycetota bacterium]
MRFWDSSAVVPLLVSEATTEAVEAHLATDPVMLVWWTTEVECSSALARLASEGGLTTRAHAEAGNRLDVLKAAWHEVQAVEVVRRTARRLLRTHRLRAADALQLAAALVSSEGDPASMEIVVLDDRLAGAAEREGLVLVEAS